MKIVILAAGKGERFGGEVPKPLIKFNGRTMLDWVIVDMIGNENDTKDIVVVTQKSFGIKGNFKIIELEGFTNGPASTAYKCGVDPDEELIVVNCDQRIFDFNANKIASFAKLNGLDAVIGVFNSWKPHNSYVNIDQDNLIAYVKEKRVISNIATNGLHYWSKASLFYESYKKMEERNDRVNGEFYISQSFNYLIHAGYRVGPYYFNFHYPIGTPEDLNNFIKREI